jgi:ribosomal protein S18 acetylase RimI-like enzyme
VADEALTAAVRVRSATPADAAAVLELLGRVARESPLAALEEVPADPEPFARALGRMGDGGAVLLAEEVAGGAPVGVAVVARGPGPARHTANLSLAVAEAARRRGVGRALVRAAAEWGAEQGIERLTASVASGNGAALALFGSLGFSVEGRRPAHLRLAGALYDEVLFGAGVAELRARRTPTPRRAGVVR